MTAVETFHFTGRRRSRKAKGNGRAPSMRSAPVYPKEEKSAPGADFRGQARALVFPRGLCYNKTVVIKTRPSPGGEAFK